ncbi:hypothetical protein AQUCO_00900259v1 [Aquilegia coerulea]|uniref:Uncharacterized protein n=1 Tax=Aquilegia coerulea TaxID=218851 RepID=A0A2G5ECV7_AQUCA|nr:hypothetical protein AQUCO_00900259v1 [Aquilegia coerulea]
MYQAKKNSKSLRRNGATHACEQRCIHCTDPASVTILVKGPSPDIIKSHFREVVEPQYWNDIIEVSKFTRFKHWTQRIVQVQSFFYYYTLWKLFIPHTPRIDGGRSTQQYKNVYGAHP